MIQEIYKAPKADQQVQKALEYLHKNAVPMTYVTAAPSTGHVPTGHIVISDTGAGTSGGQAVYFRTGKDNVITLTPPLATASNVTVADGTLTSATAQINAIIAALQTIKLMATA